MFGQEVDLSEESDLRMGRFGPREVASGNAQKELQQFLAPELLESTMSKKDQAYMFEAMVHEGFDWNLVV